MATTITTRFAVGGTGAEWYVVDTHGQRGDESHRMPLTKRGDTLAAHATARSECSRLNDWEEWNRTESIRRAVK